MGGALARTKPVTVCILKTKKPTRIVARGGFCRIEIRKDAGLGSNALLMACKERDEPSNDGSRAHLPAVVLRQHLTRSDFSPLRKSLLICSMRTRLLASYLTTWGEAGLMV